MLSSQFFGRSLLEFGADDPPFDVSEVELGAFRKLGVLSESCPILNCCFKLLNQFKKGIADCKLSLMTLSWRRQFVRINISSNKITVKKNSVK